MLKRSTKYAASGSQNIFVNLSSAVYTSLGIIVFILVLPFVFIALFAVRKSECPKCGGRLDYTGYKSKKYGEIEFCLGCGWETGDAV